MSEKIPHASVLFLFLTSFYNQNLPKMAGNGSTADEQALLEEALRMSMEVNDDTTNGTGSQSNSTTEVGGTQSRSTVSADEFAKVFAFCLATAMQHPLSPAVFQEPTRTDQSGTRFPLFVLQLIGRMAFAISSSYLQRWVLASHSHHIHFNLSRPPPLIMTPHR